MSINAYEVEEFTVLLREQNNCSIAIWCKLQYYCEWNHVSNSSLKVGLVKLFEIIIRSEGKSAASFLNLYIYWGNMFEITLVTHIRNLCRWVKNKHWGGEVTGNGELSIVCLLTSICQIFYVKNKTMYNIVMLCFLEFIDFLNRIWICQPNILQ